MKTLSRSLVALAATGLTASVVAGCGNGLSTADAGSTRPSTSSSSATPSPVPSTTPTPTTTTTTSPSPVAPSSNGGPSTTATPRPVPPTCTVGQLSVGKQTADGGGAAGSQYLLLTFKNTSRAGCTLDGHPGVSFVGKNNGTQIGAPATRTGSLRLVQLSPGETTTALLQVAEAGNYSASTCAPTTTNGFRVYPPGSYGSVFVAYRTQACQGDLSSTGSPQLSVSAVGTSG